MKKLFLIPLLILLFATCENESSEIIPIDQLNLELSSATGPAQKINICHHSGKSNKWQLINISEKAWPAHQAHGDVRLDDQDNDGYVPDNECGFGDMGDTDDNDPCINPSNSSTNVEITNIRVGGQSGDSYVGPTCNSDGTYRTCFYVSGTNLPASNPDYKVEINGVEYPIAFTVQSSSTEVVVCATDLPTGETDVDVYIMLTECTSFEKTDLYDAPSSCLEITDIRVGGLPGDSYVGPTCNSDGTYRTCFYVTGTNLPASNPDYKVEINGVEYPIAFTVQLSSTEVVVCATDLPTGETDVDVLVQVAQNISFEKVDLYDAPPSCLEITDIRVGGLPGDSYVGPTCNSDGTYRTCFYVTGTNLPASNSDYKVEINGVEYPIAFTVQLSSTEVVVCATDLPTGETDVDVLVQVAQNISFEKVDLYDAPSNCPIAP